MTFDVIARYHRRYGRDVFAMTGTDEHGKKIAETAEKKGFKPIEICDDYARQFQSLNASLNISNDFYIRTTMDLHKISAQELWKVCDKKGDLYLDTYEGWYDIKEEEFVTDATAEEMEFKDRSVYRILSFSIVYACVHSHIYTWFHVLFVKTLFFIEPPSRLNLSLLLC